MYKGNSRSNLKLVIGSFKQFENLIYLHCDGCFGLDINDGVRSEFSKLLKRNRKSALKRERLAKKNAVSGWEGLYQAVQAKRAALKEQPVIEEKK